MDVSRRQLKLSNVDSSFAEDRIKDRLEMSFSKASRGGGEVEGVEYDENTGTAVVTFLQPGGTLTSKHTFLCPTAVFTDVCARQQRDHSTDHVSSVCVLGSCSEFGPGRNVPGGSGGQKVGGG